MSDTFDSFKTSPASVPPLVRSICAAMPTTQFGNTVGPCVTDRSFRSLLDAIASIEQRLTTAGF